MVSSRNVELQSRDVLLAENLDYEAVISLRHLSRQYRVEREALVGALKDLESKGKDFAEFEGRMAAAHFALGNDSEALNFASKASSTGLGSLIQGMIAEDGGDNEAALKHYKKASELSPSSPPCVLRQLSAMRSMGQLDEALSLIENLRREFSDKADLAYYEGRCLEDSGYQQQALDSYLKAIELNPKHDDSLFRAASICDLRGLDEDALKLYERIGSCASPTYINACLNLCLLYEDMERYDEALMCCEQVLKVDPNNTRARIFLADAEASSTMYYSPEETKQSERLEAILRVPVSDFELSVRSRNCLARMNIMNLGDLVKKSESEMLAYKNFGETSLREIKEMLAAKGLRLGMMREDAATRAAHERARRGPNKELLSKSINEMELGVRARKCMDSLGLKTIGELVDRSEAELAMARNFGRVSLNEIKKRLSEMGLSLKESK